MAKPPLNTEYSTNWSVRNFNDWKCQRSITHSSESKAIPENLLESGSVDQLCHWQSLYVVKTRNKHSRPYPPKTLYQLLTGIYHHALTINPYTPNFLNKNRAFRKVHVVNNHFKVLRKKGVGSDSKHSEIITKKEENKLWESGILGLATSPKALLRAAFYNGKNFRSRGGAKHRCLELSQFIHYSEPDHHYNIYTENSSKNRQGGFAQL